MLRFFYRSFTFLLIILLLAIGGCSKKDLVQVPDLRGIPLEEAKQLARSKGLKVFVSEYGFFPSVAKGYVVTQTPFPNTNVKQTRTIALQISNGPALLKMPNLVGMEFGKASDLITKMNLYFKEILEDPNPKDSNGKDFKDIGIGYIVKQSPDTGSEIISGSGIWITVYKPGLPTVPNLIESTLEDAKSMILSSGYLVGTIVFKPSKSHARGVVTVQEPIPNSPAQIGTIINLTVNEKP